MDPDAVDRKLAAILCADVVGYSRLLAEDENATIWTLTDYREAMATLIRQHRGQVKETWTMSSAPLCRHPLPEVCLQ